MKKYFDNRELSWLKFNERVLQETMDENVPLAEKLLFSSIYQTNLDEFFMIRVGSLYDQTLVNAEDKENKTGMTAAQQLDMIYDRVREDLPICASAYNNTMKCLGEYGYEHVDFDSLSSDEQEYLSAYFNSEIRPLISPQVVDKRHPFPFLSNKEIYVEVQLEAKNSVKIGIISASGNFSRMVVLPSKEKKYRFILVEELIMQFVSVVFENYRVIDRGIIRVTRNADINMEEALYDQDVDLRDVMEELLKKRKKLSPVRLEIMSQISDESLAFFCDKLELSLKQVFITKMPLDLSFIFSIRSKLEDTNSELFYAPARPQESAMIVKGKSIIQQIQKKDILLSYPYESIKPFITLLEEAAEDEDVVSIKITLYRVAKNSKIVEALVNAAENGKDVFVLVELRARFDEENNIGWSKRLQEAGCKVMYGPQDLKVHSKLLLITRKADKHIEYITQIGTGNYNEKTSALYTDLSLMTSDVNIGAEAATVFNALSIGNLVENTKYLLVAPLSLQNKVIDFIDCEIAKAKAGKEAYIGLKFNSLTDKVLIDKLVEASQAGVKIEMVIRGICCLVAGIEGYTDNITVRSIVGRYLEHSRIYIFGKGEEMKMFISSADFMTRNTIRRVEVATPIFDKDIKERILHIFEVMLADNIKARQQCSDGNYIYLKELNTNDSVEKIDCQDYFIKESYSNSQSKKEKIEKPHQPVKVKIRRVGKGKIKR